MRGLKKIRNEKYILNFFRDLSRQKDVAITLNLNEKKIDATMSFTSKRGVEPSINTSEEVSMELNVGEYIEVIFTNKEDLYLFRSQITYSIGNCHELSIPEELYVSIRRQSPRYKVRKDDFACVALIGQNKALRIHDIGIGGLSVIDDEAMYENGHLHEGIIIKLTETKEICIDARICHSRLEKGNKSIYGMQIVNISWEDKLELFRFVYEKVYPRLNFLNELNRIDIYDVFKSAYFSGVSNENIVQGIFEKCLVTYKDLLTKPLLCTGLAYVKGGKPFNFGISTRIYDRTFYSYELFALPSTKLNPKPNTDVYIGLADSMLMNPMFDTYLSYVTRDTNKFRHMFENMYSIIGNGNKFSYDTIHSLQCTCDHMGSSIEPYDYSCLIESDPSEFLEFCNASLKPLEISAYGYNSEHFDQLEIKQEYDVLGLLMSRKLFIVKIDQYTVAYAVAEVYSEEMNINTNLDVCRVYLKNSDVDMAKVIDAIRREVAMFYRSFGRSDFCIWLKSYNHDFDNISIEGVVYKGKLLRVMANRQGMVEYKKLLAGSLVYSPKYYKLTHPQLAIWYAEKVYPGTNFANITETVIIKDEMDYAILEKAINLVIMKNDGLRLRVTDEDGEPRQYISKFRYTKIETIDFSCNGGKEGLQNWDLLKEQPAFTLNDTELFYFTMFRLSKNEGGYYARFHHLICDAWTIHNLITSKIVKYYFLLKNGLRVSSKMAPSYIDYISSEDEYKNSKRFHLQKEFWSKKFETIPECTSIKPVSDTVRNMAAKRNSYRLPMELMQGMDSYCKTSKNSPFAMFLSILAIYMSRITGKNDIVIGTPVLNRSTNKEKETIGMFISVVPVRIKVDSEAGFDSFVCNVSKELSQAFRNQKYPYEYILKDYREKHRKTENLYDVVLSFQNATLEKLDIEYVANWHFTGNMTETLAVHITDKYENGQYDIDFDFQIDVFNEYEINQMFNHYVNILSCALKDYSKRVYELDMLTHEERNRQLLDFNNTKTDYQRDKTIHQLFEEQVERTPDNIAVVFEDRKLTYRELNVASNKVARLLRKKGVKKDTIIGIMVERSLEMIISILGILKAGGAYLPLDTEYPIGRIEYMIEDSGTKLLLTQRKINSDLNFEGEVIHVDNFQGDAEDDSNLENINDPKDLAYIIYTSGSTGNPKGVMLEHRGVSNLKTYFEDSLLVNSNDRIAQFANYSFDASVWETFMALLIGGALYISTKDIKNNYLKFENFLNDNRITILSLSPTYLIHLDPEKIHTLRMLVTGGSAISKEVLNRWKDKVTYINSYGPTETTVSATGWKYEELTEEQNTVPIGKPISNTRVYILDKYNNLLPSGMEGELCVAGDTLARGYLNKKELTAEKFVPNPFEVGERMYRTGDLARWLPSGNIEYLGRMDDQVKVRGFRIELGEIENQLLGHEGVKEAIVVDQGDEDNKKLHAFYLADEEIPGYVLKEFLDGLLPSYMIPSSFSKVDMIPLTPNGKVDRKKLLILDEVNNKEIIYAAPENELEDKMCKIWEHAFSIARVGVNDNFFELGGDSLKAIEIVSKLHNEYAIEITVSQIFKLQTIRNMVKEINDCIDTDYEPIRKVLEREYYPASSAQKRMYMLQQAANEGITYNMPGIIMIEGNLAIERLENAIRKLIGRHEALRTSFHLKDGEILQKVHGDIDFRLQVSETEESIESEVSRFIRRFDLTKPPLIRCKLIKVNNEKHMLMLDMHHIISDGVSLRIFLNELVDLYMEKNIKPLDIQYKDFAVWQNRNLKSVGMRKQEEYWMSVFSKDTPVLNLPTDYKRTSNKCTDGDIISFSLDDELSEKLNLLAVNEETTLFMVLLAAFNILLSKYTGQEDIVLGSPIMGRKHADLEGIIGMFVNTLAIRNFPKSSLRFTEFLSDVRNNALNAFENQEYQFDELVEKINMKRDVSRNPLFDVMFILQNVDIPKIESEGLLFSLQELEFKVSKFDLVLQAFKENGCINFKMEYCTKLFKSETIKCMTEHYKNILIQIIEKPHIEISNMDILSADDKYRLVNEFNNTARDYPQDKTIYELFEEQVKKTPSNTAVIFEDKSLSYDELNNKANQLAMILREKGVKPETIVGIMAERSLEMVVGILGILKSGGAYLPIDPSYPQDRVKYMLEDSGVRLLLTQSSLIDRYEFDIELMDLTNIPVRESNSQNPQKVNTPDDLAYVIYTSGTTGKPKGVMIEHKSIANTISWRKDEYNLSEYDKVLQLFSFSFDGFLTSFFTPIVSGATVIILSEYDCKNPIAIKDSIKKNGITHFISVPSLYSAILEVLTPVDTFSLRIVTLAGEEVSAQIIEKSKKINESIELVNEYGPTENSVATTICRNLDKSSIITIGKPISNCRIVILDNNDNLLPIGVPGELCVSGIGLARGYWNNPELTAAKFIDNPVFEGDRMYKTGDLARWLSDGKIEFLGRVDQQVKIRGFRIELSEIENQLLSFPYIKEAIVTYWDFNGNKQLCAYYVSYRKLSVPELRKHLQKSLPDYMVPAYFIELDSIPYTPVGKVDRESLPEPKGNIDTGIEYISPDTDVEKCLAAAWAEVLGVERISMNDNFFELGGDSLAIIRVISHIVSYNWDLTIQDFYNYKTLGELAGKVAGKCEMNSNSLDFADLNTLREIAAAKYVHEEMSVSDLKMDTILLTGATGYLGIHILAELIENTSANIYCIIREKDHEQAINKLKEKMSFYFDGLFNKFIGNRVFVIDGDITEENFGLSSEDYIFLGEKIDMVMHSAALVKHFGEYGDFERVNVFGTQQVIKFTETFNRRLFHISTTSVAGHMTDNGVFFTENDFFIGQSFMENVYVRSKFEAELQVFKAIEKGVDAFVLRVGNITGRFSDGHFQINIEENNFYRFLSSIIDLGMASNELSKRKIEFTPVDLCSKAIVYLMGISTHSIRVYHLINGNNLQFGQLIKILNSVGTDIKVVSYDEFLQQVHEISKNQSKKHIVEGLVPELNLFNKSLQDANIMVSSDITNNILQNFNFYWPEIGHEYLAKVIEYMKQKKFPKQNS